MQAAMEIKAGAPDQDKSHQGGAIGNHHQKFHPGDFDADKIVENQKRDRTQVTAGIGHINQEAGRTGTAAGGDEAVEQKRIEGRVSQIKPGSKRDHPGNRADQMRLESQGRNSRQRQAQRDQCQIGHEGAAVVADEHE